VNAGKPAIGRWTLSLTGKFAQFNLALLVILVALVALFVTCLRCDDQIISYVGSGIILLLLIFSVAAALRYYLRQEPRPDGQSSSIEVESAVGQKVVIRNPPDRFFANEHTHALVRALALGYDENLCPDARVLGKAADESYQRYTSAEQKDFMATHRKLIVGKKQDALQLLAEAADDAASESANHALEATS